jgi:hypothetical protein
MLRKIAAVWFSLLVLAVGASAALPVVLQPNATAYSSTELADLNSAIGSLQTLLADPALGSQKGLGEYRWTTSLEFAAYTAGTLSERGHETRLVAQAGWPDGRHVWVLVGVPLSSGRTAWVPVEATPRAGERQYGLGSIPLRTSAGGQLEFDGAYLLLTDEISLPPNSAPVAQINFTPSKGTPLVSMTFLGSGSRDPDGEIIRYVWSFGDGTTSRGQKVVHTYADARAYLLTLTVVDNRGASRTAEIQFVVEAPGAPPAPSGSCGCGK